MLGRLPPLKGYVMRSMDELINGWDVDLVIQAMMGLWAVALA